jgi:hypothetical protein
MNIKQSTLAAAVTAALALGVSGQAAAYVYAGSVTEISNLVISIAPSSGAEITNFNFTTTNTATLNGVSAPTGSANCTGLPGPGGVGNNCGASPSPVLDGPTVTAGAPARPVNIFTLIGPSATQDWANSDSLIPVAELVNFVPTQSQTIAEANLSSGTSASANSEIQSTTTFIFNFTTTALGALDLSFDADTRLWADILGESGLGNSALASNKVSFTLTQNTGGSRVITWAPNGSNFCDDTEGLCTADDGAAQNRLNTNRSRGVNGTTDFDPALTSLTLAIRGLEAGDWSLGLNVTNSVSVNRVPEPGVLALMGMGLLGMGVAARRRKQA